MEKIVITDSQINTDIDAFACIIAYAELLKLEGNNNVIPHVKGKLNASVTREILSWDLEYTKGELPSAEHSYIIVDTSEPKIVENVVGGNKLQKIYDHHYGHEEYWKSKLGNGAVIVPIGACATLIWEEYINRGFSERIKKSTAALLAYAIVSNTLNFNASVTSERDKVAFGELEKMADLKTGWVEEYFLEQETGITNDLYYAVVNDTKVREIPQLNGRVAIGQLEMWDSRELIKSDVKIIKDAMESFNEPYWFLTSPCIGLDLNIFYTTQDEVRRLLSDKFDVEFKGSIGQNNKLLLRKEILRKLRK